MSNRLMLLNILKKKKNISGEILARRLEISRQALHKQISHLREEGYQICAKPKSGYSLVGKPDLLSPEEIFPSLKTESFGKKYFHYRMIDSTQTKAKGLADYGAPHGTVVIAEEQQSGKGRLGREWHSGKGGIWASLILRPNISIHQVPLLSLISSIAIAETIEKFCNVSCGLKWPNDVMINSKLEIRNSKFRKVCGILTEMSAESDRINWVVLGFGINVNNKIPPSLKSIAACLRDVVEKEIDRKKLFSELLLSLENNYEFFIKKGFESLRKKYLKRSILKNQIVEVSGLNEKNKGKFLDIGSEGFLILQMEGGEKEHFFAGDVTLKEFSHHSRRYS